jgi:hypothetical protein
MAVMHSQIGAMLIIIDNGKVNQETEYTCTQKIPERSIYKKIHGPSGRELFSLLLDGLIFL